MCEPVVVLAMLADPTKKVLPERNDIKRIKSRAGKKRGRPAKDCDDDSLDEARKKPKQLQASGSEGKATGVRAVE